MPAERQDRKRRVNLLSCLATMLLITADDELEYIAAFLAAHEAEESLRILRYRGPYNASHSEDFFKNLLYGTSDRRFRVFFR